MLRHMLPTLAHRPLLRRLAAVLIVLAGPACTGWTAPGGPIEPDEVDELEPPSAGTYRLVGTEEDSRTGTKEVSETYVVEPAFAAPGGVQRQITKLDDGSGVGREWETEYRAKGAFRLREVSGVARWNWDPAVWTLSLPLKEGAVWSSNAKATVPDAAGFRRVLELQTRSTVIGTETVTVAGTRVLVFLIDGTVTSTVANTNRVTQETTRLVTTTAGRTWFAPSRGLAVRSEVRTEVTGDIDGGGYTIVRRLKADRL